MVPNGPFGHLGLASVFTNESDYVGQANGGLDRPGVVKVSARNDMIVYVIGCDRQLDNLREMKRSC